jgi:hypothetical protein
MIILLHIFFFFFFFFLNGILRFFNKILWCCPKYLRNATRANMAHFVAFFISKLSEQCTVPLKSLYGANRGYRWFKRLKFTGNGFTDFRTKKSAVFAPKWTPKLHKSVFESSVMNTYDIYHEKIHYNVKYSS